MRRSSASGSPTPCSRASLQPTSMCWTFDDVEPTRRRRGLRGGRGGARGGRDGRRLRRRQPDGRRQAPPSSPARIRRSASSRASARRWGGAAAAGAGADHRGHRIGGDLGLGHHRRRRRQEGAVNSAPLNADWAVLDPELTIGLPRHVTAATGIDAMVHAIEAYTSARRKNPVSDMLAREALRLLSQNPARRLRAARRPRGARQHAARRPLCRGSRSTTRRSPASTRSPIRSAAISTCRTASRTRWS